MVSPITSVFLDFNEEKEKTLRREAFETFLDTDEAYLAASVQNFSDFLKRKGNVDESDVAWYRNNLVHIDSLSRYCIELSENDRTKELLDTLEVEWGNLISHPKADTYLSIDLSVIMSRLYYKHKDSHPDFLKKCIDMWEINLLKINVVQSNWDEYHPLYGLVLYCLYGLYSEADISQKAAEMKALLEAFDVSLD